MLLAVAVVVSCMGVDDTAAIQQAVDQSNKVVLQGSCLVNGLAGVLVPSDRTIVNEGAVKITPACAASRVCRIFSTAPGSENVHISGGEWYGDPTLAPGWQILIRLDGVTNASVRDARFYLRQKALSDAVYVGGNTPSRGVVVSDIEVDGAGRNAISITHADGIYVQHVTCTNGALGVSPGACVDIEANAAERVTRWSIFDLVSIDHQVGVYAHKSAAGYMGATGLIANSRFIRSRKHGVIVNSHEHVAVINNSVEGAPIGFSFGSQTEAERAKDVLAWGNSITADRQVILAGVADSRMLGVAGKVEMVALGAIGRMAVESVYGECTR